MATVTYDAEQLGRGATSPMRMMGVRAMKHAAGKFSFDTSYPTGGEDISEIFNLFTELMGITMEHPIDSAGTGKLVRINYTTKKVLLYTMVPAEVVNATDQSGAVNLEWIAWGY